MLHSDDDDERASQLQQEYWLCLVGIFRRGDNGALVCRRRNAAIFGMENS